MLAARSHADVSGLHCYHGDVQACAASESHAWVRGLPVAGSVLMFMSCATTEGHSDVWSVLQPEAMLMFVCHAVAVGNAELSGLHSTQGHGDVGAMMPQTVMTGSVLISMAHVATEC